MGIHQNRACLGTTTRKWNVSHCSTSCQMLHAYSENFVLLNFLIFILKDKRDIFFCKTLYNQGNKNKVTIYTPQLTITERIAFICVNMMSMYAHSNKDNTINVTLITSEILLRFYTHTASKPSFNVI